MRITRVESNLSVISGLLVRITLAVALGYFLWRVRSVLVMVIISAMLAYCLLPMVDFLTNKRFLPIGRQSRRLLSTVLVFVAFFALIWASVSLFMTPFELEAAKMRDSFASYTDQLQSSIAHAQKWYNNLPVDMQKFLGQQNFSKIGDNASGFAQRVVASTFHWIKNIWEIILIPVLAFYFVLDSRSLKREFLAMLPPWRMREAIKLTSRVSGIVQSYIIGQIILCITAGVLTGVVLHLLDMPYVLVLSVFAGITRAIPVVGPIISGIPICILGALQAPELGAALLIFVVVLHFVESKFLMPILLGERMKLHPAVILIVLLIGAEFFGLMGMFLSAPVAAIIREFVNFYIVAPRRRKLRATSIMSGTHKSDLVRSETL